MYADDTSLSDNFEVLTKLEAMKDYISINVAKTQKMLICSKSKQRTLKNSNENLYITIEDDNLKVV